MQNKAMPFSQIQEEEKCVAHVWIRFLGIITVFLIAHLSPFNETWILISLLFSHYILGVYFGKEKHIAIIKNKTALTRYLPFLAFHLLIFIPLLFYVPASEATILTGTIHSAMTEIYLFPQEKRKNKGLYNSLRFMFHVLALMILTRSTFPYTLFNTNVVGIILIIIFAALVYTHYKGLKNITSNYNSAIATELVLLGLVLLSMYYDFVILIKHVISYHVFVWIMYPLQQKKIGEGQNKTIEFLAINIGCIGVMALLTPLNPMFRSTLVFSFDFWISISNVLAVLHFSLGHATSRKNPDWIVKLFYPKKTISLK